ncbi:MAG: hypothetical protein HYZ36_06240, partial [Pedosphaera parvula]|nr:hypothetical protein [Pedosphaera parvula]
MKRRVRQLVLASGCAVVALLLVVLVEHFRGSWALQARLKELRSGGEKLQVHELLPPRISDEDNAAHAILIWTNELKKLSDKFTDLPPFMKMLSPGRAVPAWRLRRWPLKPRNSAANTPATPTNDWASLGEFLGQAR